MEGEGKLYKREKIRYGYWEKGKLIKYQDDIKD